MGYESLLEPISEEEPCGVDLEEAGDNDYYNHVMPAEDLLPGSFFDSQTGAPFSRTQTIVKSHTDAIKAITPLLERSRDIRLIALNARLEILVGNLLPFCEAIVLCHDLMERFWEQVHPGADGDMMMRQNAIEAFQTRSNALLPLEFATLVRDKREGMISYRDYSIAAGDVEPREGEEPKDKETVLSALRNDENLEDVTKTHEALQASVKALKNIRNLFVEKAGHEFSPQFDALPDILNKIDGVIVEARPELLTAEVEAAEEPESDELSEASNVSSQTTAVVQLDPGEIPDHATAAAALAAIDNFFSKFEPSAPALILVRQARSLIGKPLVDALQCLLPDKTESARINLDAGLEFTLNIHTMRELSAQSEMNIDLDCDKMFEVTNRAEAISLMMGIETFFKAVEPSSPVPLLLRKARTLLNQDFSAILKEIIAITTENTDSEEDY